MALNMVDLPAPLLPTMVAKSPSLSSRLTLFKALFSFTVPGLNVLEIDCIVNITEYLHSCFAL